MAKYQIIRSKKAISYLLNQRNLAPIRNRAITQADVDKLNKQIKANNSMKTKAQEAVARGRNLFNDFNDLHDKLFFYPIDYNGFFLSTMRKKRLFTIYFLSFFML